MTKDLEKDRIILDSRGANLLERLPKRWIRILASADALLRVVLDEEVHLEGRRLLAFLSTTLSLSANGDQSKMEPAQPQAWPTKYRIRTKQSSCCPMSEKPSVTRR